MRAPSASAPRNAPRQACTTSAPALAAELIRAYAEKVGAKVPAGRMGKPDEVAADVAFLAGDDARYLLGAEINVDGGLADI